MKVSQDGVDVSDQRFVANWGCYTCTALAMTCPDGTCPKFGNTDSCAWHPLTDEALRGQQPPSASGSQPRRVEFRLVRFDMDESFLFDSLTEASKFAMDVLGRDTGIPNHPRAYGCLSWRRIGDDEWTDLAL